MNDFLHPDQRKHGFFTIPDALKALAAGGLVILVDSKDRENEGDFVAAAEKVSPQMIHFMLTHARGQICMPLRSDLAERLEIGPMVADQSVEMPRFAIPVDHRRCRTGISPADRALTVRAIVNEASTPHDFLRPGHLFPLLARDGGVLERQGHTEASIELVTMAGLKPAAVLCEICSSNGLHMAQRDELMKLAARFCLPIVTIDDLISYVRCVASTRAESLATIG